MFPTSAGSNGRAAAAAPYKVLNDLHTDLPQAVPNVEFFRLEVTRLNAENMLRTTWQGLFVVVRDVYTPVRLWHPWRYTQGLLHLFVSLDAIADTGEL